MSKCLLYNCSQSDTDPSCALFWRYPAEDFNISQQLVAQYSVHGPERGHRIFIEQYVFFLLWPLNGPERPTQINAPCWKEQRAFRPFVLSESLMNSSYATIQRGDIPIYVYIIDLGTNLACIRQMTSPQGSLKGFVDCLWCEIPKENQYVFCSGQFCPYYLISTAV